MGPRRVCGIVGYSGNGKTTLVVRLVEEFTARGLTVSTMKHAHHGFDVDRAGKDSFRHREAGATEVMIASAGRWALLHELRESPEPGVDDLIGKMAPVDLLLIEGFKAHRHKKIEVHRPVVGSPLLQPRDPDIIAVASDAALEGISVPLLDLNDPQLIANFVLETVGRTR